MPDTVQIGLNFAGLTYMLAAPRPLQSRIEADYGGFISPHIQRPDFRVSIIDGQPRIDGNTVIGDRFEISGNDLVFRCLTLDRRGWERSVRTYLSAHIASELYARLGLVRLHAGLVRYRGKNLLISGPSGAGKTSLSLALATVPDADYYAHEMVFAGTGRMVLGWPQPFTVNNGTLTWFLEARPDAVDRFSIERSDGPELKHRIVVPFSGESPLSEGIDLILFPKRSARLGSDALAPAVPLQTFVNLAREVEVPITHNYSPLASVKSYLARAADVAERLSQQTPAFHIQWYDDQRVSVQLIDALIDGL